MKAILWSAIAACFVTGVFWQTAHAQQPLSACETGQFSDDGECEDRDDVLQFQQEDQEDVLEFQEGRCRTDLGYVAVGPRLCMTDARGPDSFANALADCKNIAGRVADYGDWRYRILFGFTGFRGIPAPVGWWLGPITADNTALYVNSARIGDFDGSDNRFGLRNYACAHDQ